MGKHIHFIGIGGIGMSALAEVAIARGATVSGSDLRPNNLTDNLQMKGAVIFDGHNADNISSDVDVAVKSTCIPASNVELAKAKELGIKVIHRSEMLADVMKDSTMSIAVTGTHGKTTTSALIAHIMDFCGMNPTVIVGGEIGRFGGNAQDGSRDLLVAEVDESDGLFREISAKCAVLTNVEREHMEHHGTMENLLASYAEFIGRIPSDGLIVYNGEDTVARSVAACSSATKVDFGAMEKGNFRYSYANLSCRRAIQFELFKEDKLLGKIECNIIGQYNAMNILGAIALCLERGLSFEEVAGAVTTFSGVKRRFDFVDRIGNIDVVEDYAHHPTELRAVIKAAGEYCGNGRVVAVFQPHRYSRTHDLSEDFVHAFYDADVLILTETYSADENPSDGKGVHDILNAIDKNKFQLVDFVKKEEIPEYVSHIVMERDIVLILGAGDIRDIARPLSDAIREKV
jgi:UDP-N-acetylmuramate--alanine ligase